jgi:hypothetical protein
LYEDVLRKSRKSAKLGAFLDVPSLETPFSKWENEPDKGMHII